MHYYQFHIGDYRRDTAHLTLLEHAIYRSLIDTSFETEQPLNLDRAKLERSHSIRSPEESTALDNILSDFFIETKEGFVHTRVQQDIEAVYAKSEKARESARKRWEKKANAMRTDSERNANASKSNANASKSDANGMLPNTHYPIPITQEPNLKDISPDVSGSIAPNCPAEKIKDLYNSTLIDLPTVEILSDARKTKLRSVWKTDKRFQRLEFWTNLFNYINTSDFLMGRSTSFQACFDWIINKNNLIKIIEGNYDNKNEVKR